MEAKDPYKTPRPVRLSQMLMLNGKYAQIEPGLVCLPSGVAGVNINQAIALCVHAAPDSLEAVQARGKMIFTSRPDGGIAAEWIDGFEFTERGEKADFHKACMALGIAPALPGRPLASFVNTPRNRVMFQLSVPDLRRYAATFNVKVHHADDGFGKAPPRKRTSPLDAEIAQAQKLAGAGNQYNVSAVWVALQKLADEQHGALIGCTGGSVKYKGRTWEETGTPDEFSKDSLRNRLRRKRDADGR